ncbi:MAG: hypothetical protein M1820_006021 [Bogoriella megaspora]|nr:MAG: hypothetical protein M1820_006021 [Bogoriella megaspora]
MASAIRQSGNAASQIASKAVHIKIWPQPADFQESREILRILQRFGEVTMFKTKKYDHIKPAPNVILAMYQDSQSAASLIKASPLKFTLEPQGPSDYESTPEQVPEHTESEDQGMQSSTYTTGSTDESNASASTSDEIVEESLTNASKPTPSSPGPRDPTQTPPPTTAYPFRPWPRPSPPPKRFHLSANPSLMNHATMITRQDRHGPFYPYTNTIGSNDLKYRVPVKGMRDVHVKRFERTAKSIRKLREDVLGQKTWRTVWEEGLKEAADRGGAVGSQKSGPLGREVTGDYDWTLPKRTI